MSAVKRACFEGHVQGVGFRKVAQKIALSLQLRGFAKNLADGSVEIQIMGEEQDLEKFFHQLKVHFSSNITKCEIDTPSSSTDFVGFFIS